MLSYISMAFQLVIKRILVVKRLLLLLIKHINPLLVFLLTTSPGQCEDTLQNTRNANLYPEFDLEGESGTDLVLHLESQAIVSCYFLTRFKALYLYPETKEIFDVLKISPACIQHNCYI